MNENRPAPSPLNVLHHWLQGRPLGLPVHSLLVHLPIGLWTLSFLFDLGSRLGLTGTWGVQAAFYTLALGLVTAIAAALFGLMDWVDLRADHPARAVANTHMVLNLAAMALYLFNGWVRLGLLTAEATPFAPLALSFVAIALLYVSGYLGGRLVYDEGVGVGRHRRQGELPEETLGGPQVREAGEFVPVVNTQKLNQAEAVRVEVNGYALALARVGDQYYAVQDYCTHRYGPLSDGRLCYEEAEIECPWHRSRFDLRTGGVTNGPAKEPLNTFETRVVEGVVHVRVPAEPPSPRPRDEPDQEKPVPHRQREAAGQTEA